MNELLPCPFCGGNASVMLLGSFYRVGCGDCLSVGVDNHYRDDAIDAWNRRAQPVALDAPDEVDRDYWFDGLVPTSYTEPYDMVAMRGRALVKEDNGVPFANYGRRVYMNGGMWPLAKMRGKWYKRDKAPWELDT